MYLTRTVCRMFRNLELIQKSLVLLLAIQLIVPADVWGQAHTSSGRSRGAPAGEAINLDLTSTASTLTPGNLVRNEPVPIQVGTTVRNITPNSLLTPAERLAVYQVVSTGRQSIEIAAAGNAVGGSFNIGPRFSQFISSLIVPAGVTAVKNFATSSTFALAGNLTNQGTLVAVSTNPAVNSATISANNIVNQQGALLTSVLPGSGVSGIAGALASLSLNLVATQSIVNAGTITSSGALNMTAGGTITNALPAGAAGQAPLMQAVGAVNLVSGNGGIVNSGQIASLTNNVNLAAMRGNDLIVNNTGGQIQALSGTINVRDALFKDAAGTSLLGGDWLSRELNLYTGKGSVEASLGKVTGVVNATGSAAHVWAENGTLTLGNIDLSGDPTFATSGDLKITGDITVGQSLAILAGQDIEFTGGSTITTRDGTGQGNDIYIVAGANITPGCSTCPGPLPSGLGLASAVSQHISGPSLTGGNIEASAVTAPIVLDASSTGGIKNGGDVVLVALVNNSLTPGNRSHGGQILLPATSTIKTSGSGSGVNGDVTFMAPAAGGIALTTGSVEANGSSGGGGNVTIETRQLAIDADFGTNGAFSTTGVGFSGANTDSGHGAVIVNGNIFAGSAITAQADYLSVVSGMEFNAGTTMSLTVDNLLIRGGSVYSGGDLTVTQSSNRDLSVMVVGGALFSIDGNLNITHTGTGKLFVLNQFDGGTPSVITAQGTGRSIDISTLGPLVITGNGFMLADADINLTSSNSFVVAGQSTFGDSSDNVNVTASTSILVYGTSSSLSTVNAINGQTLTIFVDNLGNRVFHSANTAINLGDTLVLSTDLTTVASISSNQLSVLNVSGDLIVSTRNDPTVLSVAGITTNGNAAYIESLDATNGLTFDSDITTSQVSGTAGALYLYSRGGINSLTGPASVNGHFNTSGDDGSGGNIYAYANGNIQTIGINANAGAGVGPFRAGAILVATTNGDLVTSAITARGDQFTSTAGAFGGNITLSVAGNIQTTIVGSAPSSAGIQSMGAFGGTAGNIFINATGNLTIDTDLGVEIGVTAWGGQTSPGGGNIVVDVGGSISAGTIDSTAGGLNSGVAGPVTGIGNSGWITLRAGTGITLSNYLKAEGGIDNGYGGSIHAYTVSGPISITEFVDSNGGINAAGDAGSIRLYTTGAITITNGSATAVAGPTGGTGGSVLFHAAAGITVGSDILSSGNGTGNGGKIEFTSTSGQINITGALDSSARGTSGTGGAVYVNAPDGFTANSINAIGGSVTGGGGAITFESSQFITVNTFVDSSASPSSGAPNAVGNAGVVTMPAATVSVGSIRAQGGDAGGNGADITITNGTVGGLVGLGAFPFLDSSACQCDSGNANTGNAGKITVDVGQGITGNPTFRAEGGHSGGNGADITITANGADANIGFVSSSAQCPFCLSGTGNAGKITVTANNTFSIIANSFRADGGITTGNGGDITLLSTGGQIQGTFVSATALGNGTAGLVQITANGGITFIDAVNAAGFGTTASGNNITVTSTTGSISIGFFLAYGSVNAGNVKLVAPGTITVGDINAYAVVQGGNVTVSGGGTVTVGRISTAGGDLNTPGNAGTIRLVSSGGDVNLNGAFYDANANSFTNSAVLPGDIIIVAFGNVIATAPPLTTPTISAARLGTQDTPNSGGNVHIVAGFNVTVDTNGVNFQFNGKSLNGGNIDLSQISGIFTNSVAGGGGNITLVATSGTGNSATGLINLPQNMSTANTAPDIDASAGGVILLASNTITGPASAGIIDMSTIRGAGGRFVAIAGFDAAPPTSPNQTFPNVMFTVGSASASGGNVFLSGTSIHTNVNSNCGCPGGNVGVFAHTGTGGINGDITMGEITTFSHSGTGGSIRILGGGTSGASPGLLHAVNLVGDILTGEIASPFPHVAGSVSAEASEPGIVGGTVAYTNGVFTGTGGTFQASGTALSSLRLGGNIIASGANSLLSIFPTIFLNANNITEVGGSINTSGNIDIRSQNLINIMTAPGPQTIRGENGISISITSGPSSITEASILISQADLFTFNNIDISVLNAIETLSPFGARIRINSLTALTAHRSIRINAFNSVPLTKLPYINIQQAVTATAGTLTGSAPATGVLAFTDILTFGSITIKSGGEVSLHSQIGQSSTYTANGGDVRVEAQGEDIYLSGAVLPEGDLHLIANGGNVILLAAADVESGGGNNTILARAVGNLTHFLGGVVEIGSGMTPADFSGPLMAANIFFANRQPDIAVDDDTKAILLAKGFDIDNPGPGTIDLLNGSALFKIVSSPSGFIDLTGTIFSIDGGGIILRDPPDVILPAWTITAIAPPLTGSSLPSSTDPPVTSPPSVPTTPVVTSAPPVEPPVVTSVPDPIILPTDKTPPQTPPPPLPQPAAVQYVQLPVGQPSFFIISSNCSAYTFDALPDAYLQGSVGTVFQVAANRSTQLQQGRVLIGAGRDGMTMQVGDETVEMAPRTVALIDARPLMPVRVTVLDAPEGQDTKISKNGQNVATLASGDEAVLTNNDIKDEELIPVDGVDRQYVAGTIQKEGVKIRQAKVPVAKLLEREPLLRCCLTEGEQSPICHLSWPYKQLMKKYGSSLEAGMPARSPLSYRPENRSTALDNPASGDLRLVAFTPPPVARDFLISSGDGISRAGDNHYKLSGGSVLLQSESATRIDTAGYSVYTQPGASVVVSVDGDLVHVFDLADKNTDDVQVVIGKQKIPLKPGQELSIMPSGKHDAYKVVAADGIARRRMRMIPSTGGADIVMDDFSLVDALTKSPLLKQLRKSQERRDQQAIESILKMAAAISVSIDRSRGPYSTPHN